ncbi:GUN4 domain-containing protein [Nodularia sphaerocarpa]|uniref:GUN4 domain-containing protein n=1 Tax=Nodularia sphaerocarpa TaxID=137816 RepID=UPI00232F4F27|nr:GUN4 domain-containing protein [Nodularia sphaerocarpa]MDB9372324.1 GUN4 domain-containing protein [Nodularia sphaerocarpa CS-585]MDB9377940.1 GUN4 domain-containing protein [Nodularia sphaerocarpa CS-585A2]
MKLECLRPAMRSLFILGFSLVTLAANQLSVLAQTRQPTNAEIKKLRQEFQESIRYYKNNSTVSKYVEDRRTQAEKNERESFVRAWSKLETQLAPFMGRWYGYESGRYIYPSNTKGRVCVVVKTEGTATLNTGVLFNGVIRQNNGGLLFKEGDFLGAALLEKGRFIRDYETPFHHPRLLQPLTKVLDSLYRASPSEKNQLAQQFKAAGCTTSITTLKPKNTSNTNSSLVSAIKNAIGNSFSEFFDRIEYFAAEVDLNSDGTKEVIVYTASPICGTWECPVYIFKKSGSGYHLIGKTAAASNEAQIAVLKNRSNGWLDLATLGYNSQERKFNWKLHKFNGSEYKNTFQNLTSTPSQIILRPNRGSGINLGRAKITSNNNSSLVDPQAEPSIISSSTPVMFQKLETLLQAGKWKDADLETWELMKKVTKREKEGELKKEDYQNFPKKELQIMDQLWLKYSNGKFGFSVQKQIWLELGGKYNGQHYDMNTFLKLVERVGWRRNRTNLSYNDFTFSTNAPRGHLPTGELASGRGQTGLLFSRL